ncbi:MAG: PHP domain-containing protein [Spirochaetales bacterium]|nr:PHP domain-containing protein [Spirochaetales bacterium]
MGFLYETHLHTCLASACGISTGKEHVRYYKEIGFTGIMMTDHFFGGNTRIPRYLPWEERIDLFFRGYEDALEEGLKVGLDVFFGLEQNFDNDEYLIYGLTKEYMKAHPELEHWTRTEQLREVHRAGGAVIQAHPFRLRGYIDYIRLGELFADGVEVANVGNEPLDDARAYLYARQKGLLMTAGTDNHKSPPKAVFGIELDEKLGSIDDYVKIILQRGKIGLYVPEGRFDMPDAKIDERHKAYRLNEREEMVPMEDTCR